MLRAMPNRAKEIIRGGDFTGADLVQVASDLHRPSFKDWDFVLQCGVSRISPVFEVETC